MPSYSNVDDDHGGPARKRMPTIAVDKFRVPNTTIRREDRVPDVDWTGHQYKSSAACIKAGIDYDHVGRESTAERGKYR